MSNDDEDKPKRLALRTIQTNKYGLAKVSDLLIPELSDSDSLVRECAVVWASRAGAGRGSRARERGARGRERELAAEAVFPTLPAQR